MAIVRVFSTAALIFIAFMGLAQGWFIWNDLRGAEVTAEIVRAETVSPKRSELMVRFTTSSGDRCGSLLVRDSLDAQQTGQVGDRITVHHQRYRPCLNVREPSSRAWWGGLVPTMLLLAAISILAYLAWRRPHVFQRRRL